LIPGPDPGISKDARGRSDGVVFWTILRHPRVRPGDQDEVQRWVQGPPGSRIETFQRFAAHSGSARGLPGRKTIVEERGQIDVGQRVAGIVFRHGRRIQFGSRNEVFQEVAARFGSLRAAAEAVVAVGLAHYRHHSVDRAEDCARHRIEADEQSLFEAVELRRDELAGRLSVSRVGKALVHGVRPDAAGLEQGKSRSFWLTELI
jgi:hypothetical protein